MDLLPETALAAAQHVVPRQGQHPDQVQAHGPRRDQRCCEVRIAQVVWRSLLANPKLSLGDILVYQVVWQECPLTLTDLARLTRQTKRTAALACASLQDQGWLSFVKAGTTKRPIALLPHDVQEQLAKQLDRHCKVVGYVGEFLMRRYLDWRLTSEEFIDNARPTTFTNPSTGERLESDRLYFDGVAFEFNGPQHYHETKKYASTKQLNAQKTRDLIKLGLSMSARIPIVVIAFDELHPATVESKIPASLRRRPIDTDGPYYRAFVERCDAYVAEAQSWIASRSTR